MSSIEFSHADPPVDGAPAHPGFVVGRWPDGFCVALPMASDILDDPYARDLLVERYERIRVAMEP